MPWAHDDIGRVLADLREGRIAWDSNHARGAFLFPASITVPETLHIMFNGLEESLKSTAVWAPFEEILREVVSFMGDKTLRQRFIAVCVSGSGESSKSDRARLHSFDGHKFDWRWEMLELVSVQLLGEAFFAPQ